MNDTVVHEKNGQLSVHPGGVWQLNHLLQLMAEKGSPAEEVKCEIWTF